MAITLAESRTLLANNLRILETETGVYGTAAERDAMLNRGAKDFCRRTRCLRNYATFNTTASTQEYNLLTVTETAGDLSTFLQVDRDGGVYYNGQRIAPTTLAGLVTVEGTQWPATSASTPYEYYMRNFTTMGLYPTPNSALSVAVYFIERPADMTATTDTPFNNETWLDEYNEAPILYATWKLLLRARQFDESTSNMVNYLKMVADCYKDIRDMEDDNTRFIPNMSKYRRKQWWR